MEFDRLRDALQGLGKTSKQFCIVSVDAVLVIVALWIAFALRLGGFSVAQLLEYDWLFAAALCTAFPTFVVFGLHKTVVRFLGKDSVGLLLRAVVISGLLLALVVFISRTELVIPRTVVFIYPIVLFCLMISVRSLARSFLVPRGASLWEVLTRRESRDATRKKVVIYGAGDSGHQLYRNLENDRSITVVGFVDDDKTMQGRRVAGVPVYSTGVIPQFVRKGELTDVFLAMPALEPSRKKDILGISLAVFFTYQRCAVDSGSGIGPASDV